MPILRAGNSGPKQPVRFAAANSRSDPITLGIASINTQKKIAEYQDFVNYLTRKLTSRNSRRGTLHVVPTPFELAQLLIDHKIDFFMDSPYPTHRVNAHAGSRLLARRWKNGVSEYRSVIITRKDSGIARLEDLRGTIIAFEDRDSTSGYFLPRTLLARKGSIFGNCRRSMKPRHQRKSVTSSPVARKSLSSNGCLAKKWRLAR